MTELPSAPAAPEPVKVENDNVTLQWSEPDFDGNSPIIEYILEYQEKESTRYSFLKTIIKKFYSGKNFSSFHLNLLNIILIFRWNKVTEKITKTSHTVSGLTSDTEYTFRIKAVNAVGPSDPSPNSKWIKTPQVMKESKNKPGPPRGPLEISGMTKTSFTIKWEPPEDDGGADIIEYIVEMKEASKKSWQKVVQKLLFKIMSII